MDSSSVYGIDDFKHKIHTLLTDRDTKGALKARLRADILNISRQNGFSSKETSRTPLDLEEKAIVSLMYKFLKSRNMDVVLSILLPAVGMHSPRDVLNDQDIAAFLNLTPSDDTTTPDLQSLVRHVRKSASNMSQELKQRDISCQTANGDEFIGLEEKLRMIDHAYAQPLGNVDTNARQMDEMEERLTRQIHQQHELKNAAYLSSQRDIIRAEERIKFERNYLEQASSSDEKCRSLRDELAAKERRLHDDLRVRSDEMDRINYNQRQHMLKELQRVQDREAQLYKLQSELDSQIRLYGEKHASVDKLITLRVDAQMAEYDAENCGEKERAIVARKKADAILSEVTRQHVEMCEDKDAISRLRGENKRLTAELGAERAAHSSVQVETGELNALRIKHNELTLELAQLKGEHSNLGVYRAQAKEVPTLRQTVNMLSAKILTTEKELARARLENQSYKTGRPIEVVGGADNMPIDESEDSLLAKARERWADMSSTSQSPSKKAPRQKIQNQNKIMLLEQKTTKRAESKVTFIENDDEPVRAGFKAVSSTPLPVHEVRDSPDESSIQEKSEIEKSAVSSVSVSKASSRAKSSQKSKSSRHSSPIPDENDEKKETELSLMSELSMTELGDGTDNGGAANTIERIMSDKTEEKFSPLEQVNKSDSNMTQGTQDGSFHSSQYTGVDFSVSLSAISGEFRMHKSETDVEEERSAFEPSTEHDTSDFDEGIKQFALDDQRWNNSTTNASRTKSQTADDNDKMMKSAAITLEQMSLVSESTNNDSW